MKFIIGLLLSCIGFYAASVHLEQHLKDYWDFVAFSVVIFGSLAILVIGMPYLSALSLLKIFLHKFFFLSPRLKQTAMTCYQVSSDLMPLSKTRFIEEQILNDGLELISLGMEKEKIEHVLYLRIENYEQQIHLLSGWLRRTAKYPPAFGLAGTVLGLIHLMRGISDGITTKETGLRMAVALVATFYGIIISNLILNPLGEWLLEQLKFDQRKCEMAIETIFLIIDKENSIHIQETLNSYLAPEDRLKDLSLQGLGDFA